MSGAAIQVTDLTKSYGELEAVRGVDLEVGGSEIFALLGPNGAGKTTTVEILEGYRQRDGGDVHVLGRDPWGAGPEHRNRVGVVLQETGLERYLTVGEILEMYAGYYGSPRPTAEVLELVGLTERRSSRVSRLSGGQLRRLDVAVGLIGDPDLLFLDEPTTGFDPSARRGAWEMLRDLRSLGKTVFLTTHYMDEAQALADRVAIIVDGRIVAEGAPDALVAPDATRTRIRFTLPPGTPDAPDIIRANETGGKVTITSERPVEDLHRITSWASERGLELADLWVARPTLEDVYIELTTGSERAEAGASTSGRRKRRRR